MRGAAAVHATAACAATPAATTKQRDPIGFDFGGIALLTVLVIPLTGLQPAFYVNLFPFDEVFLEGFGLLAPEHHAVPLGLFLPLPLFVVPHLGRRHVEGGDRGAPWRVSQLG